KGKNVAVETIEKLSTVWYGSDLYDAAATAWPPVTSNRVWPSGAALATTSAPIVPPAPGRVSTTRCCPRPFAMSAASIRATPSPLPPAGYGTTSPRGRAGNSVAWPTITVAERTAAPRTGNRTQGPVTTDG